jgi:hypothetical protein
MSIDVYIIVTENPFKTGSHINPINLSPSDLPPIFRNAVSASHREVPVSITQEEIVHVPRVVYQHRHHHAEVEQVVDLHVPHHIEETVSVPKVHRGPSNIFGDGGWIGLDICCMILMMMIFTYQLLF